MGRVLTFAVVAAVWASLSGCLILQEGLREVERGERRRRVWVKPDAGQYEFDSDAAACMNEAGVGILPESVAMQRADNCLISRGWRVQQ